MPSDPSLRQVQPSVRSRRSDARSRSQQGPQSTASVTPAVGDQTWGRSDRWASGSGSTLGAHGPSMMRASSSPGHGGRAVQVKTRGTPPVQRYFRPAPDLTLTREDESVLVDAPEVAGAAHHPRGRCRVDHVAVRPVHQPDVSSQGRAAPLRGFDGRGLHALPPRPAGVAGLQTGPQPLVDAGSRGIRAAPVAAE